MQSVRQGQLAVAAARGAWMQAVPTTHLLDENEWYSFEDERNDEHMVRKAGAGQLKGSHTCDAGTEKGSHPTGTA